MMQRLPKVRQAVSQRAVSLSTLVASSAGLPDSQMTNGAPYRERTPRTRVFPSGAHEPQSQAEIEQEWRMLIRLLQSQVDDLRIEVRNLSGQVVIPLDPE